MADLRKTTSSSKTSSKASRRGGDPLAMKIYSAFLGGLPRILHDAKMIPAIEDDTPFHAPSLRRQIRRAKGSASRALDEARERLNRAALPLAPVKQPQSSGTQLVLIGSVAVRRRAAAERARPAA